MNSKNFIIDKEYALQKFSGKGGWTYIALPEIAPNKNMPFGWVMVSGFVDTYKLVKCKLLPMGNKQLFLPIKAEIRKKIKKQVHDIVHLKLFIDTSPLQIPKEIIKCFENEPKKVSINFMNLSEGQQKAFLDWIYSAKTEDTKAARIIQMINRVIKNEPFYKKNTNNK